MIFISAKASTLSIVSALEYRKFIMQQFSPRQICQCQYCFNGLFYNTEANRGIKGYVCAQMFAEAAEQYCDIFCDFKLNWNKRRNSEPDVRYDLFASESIMCARLVHLKCQNRICIAFRCLYTAIAGRTKSMKNSEKLPAWRLENPCMLIPILTKHIFIEVRFSWDYWLMHHLYRLYLYLQCTWVVLDEMQQQQ